jgi:hypothetical protein
VTLAQCVVQQPASPVSPAARFAAQRKLSRRSSVGHKVGQDLVIATSEDTFGEVAPLLRPHFLPSLQFSTESIVLCMMSNPLFLLFLTSITCAAWLRARSIVHWIWPCT